MEKMVNVEAKKIILDDEERLRTGMWRRRGTDGLGKIGLPHVLVDLTPAFYVETCVLRGNVRYLSPVTCKLDVEAIL
jgi:hypothetical protein